MAKGKTTTLTVSFEPESATDKTFRAVSADPSKATISVKDMTITVNGVATGKVQIPVVSGNGQFAAQWLKSPLLKRALQGKGEVIHVSENRTI
ncbi:Ig-like domain-containing protein [Escherichia coli]|uniref:Ig-like domain-containing protein n=1 Tax=Escherichia coli TaxID=562 RepID=UPI003AF772DB